MPSMYGSSNSVVSLLPLLGSAIPPPLSEILASSCFPRQYAPVSSANVIHK